MNATGDTHGATTPPRDDGEGLPQEARLRFVDSYGLVLVMLVATYFLSATVGDYAYGRSIALVSLAMTTWLTLRASRVERRLPTYAFVLIALAAIVGVSFGVIASDEIAKLASVSLNVILVLVAPVVIARRLVSHHVINAETFYGAVCLYLMIAMFFASCYALIALITGEPFFAQGLQETSSTDYLYFSLTTITTTGYGDLTAQGSVGRLLAMSEAVLGQLYLITVVAMVVQNLGRERQFRSKRNDRDH